MPGERRGQALLAWAVILGLVGFMLLRTASRPKGDGADRIGMKVQGRYLVGLNSFGMGGDALLEQARPQFQKDAMQRLAFVALAGEVAGAEAARKELKEVEAETEDEAWAAELLEKLLDDEEVADEDGAWLVKKLGWFGKLALSRQDEVLHAALVAESRRTVIVLVAFFVMGLMGLVTGVAVAVAAGYAAARGWVAAPPVEGRHGGIHAETFAVYLVLFIGASYLASFLRAGDWSLGLSGLVMVLSLVALYWPRLRGLTWERVRDDLGLRARWLDLPAGVAAYVGALPLVVVGLLISLGAMMALKRFGVPHQPPSHPVADAALGVPWWVWAQIFVVACVCAPVVEEIFFRGVLYTHLRRLGKAWPAAARVALAVGVSSFLFAVIHPQGLLGVPILGALAAAFALAREWSDSVVPGMVAHAINNGVATLVLFLAIA